MNLALPGMGSIAAGRKVGYFQAAMALVGMAMTGAFGLNFGIWYFTNYSKLQASADPLSALQAVWHEARWPLLGFAVFALALLWALVTSLAILARTPPERGAKQR